LTRDGRSRLVIEKTDDELLEDLKIDEGWKIAMCEFEDAEEKKIRTAHPSAEQIRAACEKGKQNKKGYNVGFAPQQKKRADDAEQKLTEKQQELETAQAQTESTTQRLEKSAADVVNLKAQLDVATQDAKQIEQLRTELEAQTYEMQRLSDEKQQIERQRSNLEATLRAKEAEMDTALEREKQRADDAEKAQTEKHSLYARYARLVAMSTIDESKYLQWQPDEVADWILSLEPEKGAFAKYDADLRAKLNEEAVSGRDLNDLTQNELRRYGIVQKSHRSVIMAHIEQLGVDPREEDLQRLREQLEQLESQRRELEGDGMRQRQALEQKQRELHDLRASTNLDKDERLERLMRQRAEFEKERTEWNLRKTLEAEQRQKQEADLKAARDALSEQRRAMERDAHRYKEEQWEQMRLKMEEKQKEQEGRANKMMELEKEKIRLEISLQNADEKNEKHSDKIKALEQQIADIKNAEAAEEEQRALVQKERKERMAKIQRKRKANMEKALRALHMKPENYRQWDVKDVIEWAVELRKGMFSRYADELSAVFEKHQIKGEAFERAGKLIRPHLIGTNMDKQSQQALCEEMMFVAGQCAIRSLMSQDAFFRQRGNEKVDLRNIRKVMVIAVCIAEYDTLPPLSDTWSDCDAWRDAFERVLGYTFISNIDSERRAKFEYRLTLEQLEAFLVDCRSKCITASFDAVIVTVSAHGSTNGIVCSDGLTMSFAVLRSLFNFGELAEKVRLYFMDVCRVTGDAEEKAELESETDTPYTDKAETMSATVFGNSAGRAVKGGMLARYLSEAFKDSARKAEQDTFQVLCREAKKGIRALSDESQTLTMGEFDPDLNDVVFRRNDSERGSKDAEPPFIEEKDGDKRTINFTADFKEYFSLGDAVGGGFKIKNVKEDLKDLGVDDGWKIVMCENEKIKADAAGATEQIRAAYKKGKEAGYRVVFEP